MDEKLRNEIVQRWQAQTPQRQIARELGVARTTVQQVIYRFGQERLGPTPASPLPKSSRRPSSLDEHEPFIGQLLERYPNMTAVRVYEELRARGFHGSYTIVRQRVRALRPQPARLSVQLRLELFAACLHEVRRGAGLHDHDSRARPRLRVPARRSRRLFVRQYEGRGA